MMSLKSYNLDAQNDQFDNEMAQVRKEFRTKLDRTKQFVSDCQNFQDISDNMGITNLTNDLSFPDFDAEANYNKSFWQVYLKNEILLKVIKQVTEQTTHLHNSIKEIQVFKKLSKSLQESYMKLSRCKSRKKNRRLAVEIEKKHICPYKECSKIYGSDVSLNLHIKLKHNGGNKTDREKLAQEICEAELSGKLPPELSIQFPPGYLNAFKQYYRQNRRMTNPDS